MSSVMEAIKKGLKLKAVKASKEEAKVSKWVKKKLPKLIAEAVSEDRYSIEVDFDDLGSNWELICKVLFEVEGIKRMEKYKVSGYNFLGWELEYRVVRIEFKAVK